MLAADVCLYLRLLHGDKVAGRAADGEHPLLLVHVERHVADKLDVELRLKSTHVTAGPKERCVSFQMEATREHAVPSQIPTLTCVGPTKGLGIRKPLRFLGWLGSGHCARQIKRPHNVTSPCML